MEKQTKNIITREWVEKELRFYNTADIRSSLVLLGALSLLFVPLTVVLVDGLLSVLNQFWFQIPVAVLVGGLLSSPLLVNLFSLLRSFREKRLLQGCDFDVVTRKVLYKSEKIVNRQEMEYLHFDGFEKIAVSHTTYQLAEEGDAFYIVYFKGYKTIKELYPAKLYEYRGA